MAYREFHNELTYAAPQIGDLPRTLDAVRFVEQQKALQRQRQYDAANHIKAYDQKGDIIKLQNAMGERIKEGTARAYNDVYNTGKISEPTRQHLLDTELFDKRQVNLKNALALREKQIQEIGTNDPYLNKQYEIDKGRNLVVEHPNEPTELGEKLDLMENQINNLKLYDPEEVTQNFNQPKFLSDYVTRYPYKNVSEGVEQSNGVENNKLQSSRFWVGDNPGVGEEHINEYLNAHKMLPAWYAEKAKDQLIGDINSYKDEFNKDERLKGLSDNEIYAALHDHPELNKNPNAFVKDDKGNLRPIDFNERIRNLAKNDLELHNALAKKTDYKMKNYNPSSEYNTRDKVNVSHGYDNSGSFNSPELTFSNNDKINSPLKLKVRPKNLIDINTGKSVGNISDLDFDMNSLKILLLDRNNQPIPIQANNIDDFKKAVDKIPTEQLLNAKVKLGIQGTATSKKSLANELDKLRKEPISEDNKTKMAALTKAIKGTPMEDNEQALIQQMDIVTPFVIPFDNGDHTDQQIENATKGDGQKGFKAYRDVKGDFRQNMDYINQRVRDESIKAKEKHQKFESTMKEIQKGNAEKTKSPVKSGEKKIKGKSGKDIFIPE